jgi:hypothetical protein
MSKDENAIIEVQGGAITILSRNNVDYISLTDMFRAKDSVFFISDWLRNRNTVEFLGIWERLYNPDFNSGEFDTINSRVGLNKYMLSVKECARGGAMCAGHNLQKNRGSAAIPLAANFGRSLMQ